MISFRPKKTGPRPLVTVREVYDKTCAVERAVGELQRTLDGRAAQRSHVLRYLGIAAVLTLYGEIQVAGAAHKAAHYARRGNLQFVEIARLCARQIRREKRLQLL